MHRTPRRAFTLLELLVASALMAVLVVLLGHAWYSLGRLTVDGLVRSRLTHEARLAIIALGEDLGGSLGDSDGRLGLPAHGKFVGRAQPGGTQLWLCFDGGASPNGSADWGSPDTVIAYEVQDGALLRSNQANGTQHTVARHVTDFQVVELGGRVQITLTLTYRTTTKTYTFVARDP